MTFGVTYKENLNDLLSDSSEIYEKVLFKTSTFLDETPSSNDQNSYAKLNF